VILTVPIREVGGEVHVEAESEGSTAKRRRLTNAGQPKESEMVGAAEPDIESIMDSEVEPNGEGVVNRASGPNLQCIVHTETEMQEGEVQENSEAIAACS
jgi:hypothetical protein